MLASFSAVGKQNSCSGGGAHFLSNRLSSLRFPLLFPHKDDGQSWFLYLPETVTLTDALKSHVTVKPMSAVRASERKFGLMMVNPAKENTEIFKSPAGHYNVVKPDCSFNFA